MGDTMIEPAQLEAYFMGRRANRRMSRAARSLLVLAAAGVLTLVCTNAPTATATTRSSCALQQLPVSLGSGQPTGEHLGVQVCLPRGNIKGVLITVPGGSYNSTYWNFPDTARHTSRYSFTDSATDRGYAVLNMDRLGTGSSSRPPGVLVTPDADAWTIHSLVQAVRDGQISGLGKSSAKIVTLGHSLGTIVTWLEASTYHDVSAAVFTSFTHTVRLDTMARLGAAMAPAALYGQTADPGYITTRPGTRGIFYEGGPADPAVLQTDEQTKDVAAVASFLGMLEANPYAPLPELDIRVPVLLAVGQRDQVNCGSVPALGGVDCSSGSTFVDAERKFLGPNVPSVDGYVLPDAGHDMNMAANAEEWFGAALAWIDGQLSR
jgi:pimeloyl-ACP methyl ester carboxylesterase